MFDKMESPGVQLRVRKATAVSSRGLGRSPLKAQTRVRIPLPLFGRCVARSSIGQDGTLSRCREGFDSPTGYGGEFSPGIPTPASRVRDDTMDFARAG